MKRTSCCPTGWGVLSVDDTGDTKAFGTYAIEMQVKDSVIDVTTDSTEDPSCYATYSIGGCREPVLRLHHRRWPQLPRPSRP